MTQQLLKIRRYIENQIRGSDKCRPWFFDEHVAVVEEMALELLKHYPQADKPVVLLAVWFHDLGRAFGVDDGHDVWGADKAKDYLTTAGFPPAKVEAVAHACRTHRVKDSKPQTIEAKILATADALSHFHNGFYLRIFHAWSKRGGNYGDLREKLLQKIERDYHHKLLLTEAKDAAKPLYESWREALMPIKLP